MSRQALIERIRALSRPLQPLPTGRPPRLPELPLASRTVIFDVYGTLLISASGDVGTTAEDSREALTAALAAVELSADAGALLEALHAAITASHRKSREAEGIDYPEIDIRECWAEAFHAVGMPILDRVTLERLAIEYECRVNPTWPMPGAGRLLLRLHRSGYRLGILSNAQFYTPLVLEALLGAPVEALGFDPALCLWSWRTGHGKPSAWLFHNLDRRLAGEPAPLYVGNDLLKDIWPASAVGWHTALFAGDARSLRLREGDPRVREVRPDAVVTELAQISEILK